MRIALLLSLQSCLYVIHSSHAFVTTTTRPLAFVGVNNHRHDVVMKMSRTDASSAIENAQQAVAKYGADSLEARLAWEVVEEIDGSDNSIAYQKTAAEECSTEGSASLACMEYEQKLEELTKLLQEQQPRVQTMRNIAEGIRRIRMADGTGSLPSGDRPSADTPAYKMQLDDLRNKAESITKELGADSAESRLAWTEYEELASTGAQAELTERLDEMCLVETQAMEACEALDELSRVLNLQKSKSRYSG